MLICCNLLSSFVEWFLFVINLVAKLLSRVKFLKANAILRRGGKETHRLQQVVPLRTTTSAAVEDDVRITSGSAQKDSLRAKEGLTGRLNATENTATNGLGIKASDGTHTKSQIPAHP